MSVNTQNWEPKPMTYFQIDSVGQIEESVAKTLFSDVSVNQNAGHLITVMLVIKAKELLPEMQSEDRKAFIDAIVKRKNTALCYLNMGKSESLNSFCEKATVKNFNQEIGHLVENFMNDEKGQIYGIEQLLKQ